MTAVDAPTSERGTRVPIAARAGAAGLLGLAAAWPHLPVHPPGLCALRATTGVPCPLCGLTRSVVAAVRGDVGASLAFHPAGLLAVALALAVVAGARLPRVRAPAWVLVPVVALVWAYNVALNPTF